MFYVLRSEDVYHVRVKCASQQVDDVFLFSIILIFFKRDHEGYSKEYSTVFGVYFFLQTDSQLFVYFVYVMGHCHTTDITSTLTVRLLSVTSKKVHTAQLLFSPLEAYPVFTTHSFKKIHYRCPIYFIPVILATRHYYSKPQTSCKIN